MTFAVLVGVFAAMPAIAPPPPQDPPPKTTIEAHGSLSFMNDILPRMDAFEFRPRATVNVLASFGSHWRARFDAQAEGLWASRNELVVDGDIHIREGWVEASGARFDLRAGVGRIVWGRLDEIQPSDVINPIDAARFIFEGRSEARLAVPIVRARWFNGEHWTLEGVLAPVFKRGTFDSLDERTSPFNLVNDAIVPALIFGGVRREEPAVTWRNMSGGGRFSATAGRLDVAVAAYRGFEGFGPIQFEPIVMVGPFVIGRFTETFPRFMMVSADFEVVLGDWEVRGETAAFVEKYFAGESAPGIVRGRAIDAGFGVNRGTGIVHVFASVLVHRQWSDEDPLIDRTDVTLVGSLERAFGRDRYMVRVFGATTPADASGFLRGLFAWRLRDNLTLELSAAKFMGHGETTLGRFEGRDFLLARLRYDW
jgi:hypothetical protein